MTPEAQRIAIAEACCLFRLAPLRRTTRKGKESPDGVVLWYCEAHHGGEATYVRLPDYLSDLNAMHEAEKAVIYADGPESDLAFDYLANLVITADAGMSQSAAAAQRAEAFLRTLNKWNGGQG